MTASMSQIIILALFTSNAIHEVTTAPQAFTTDSSINSTIDDKVGNEANETTETSKEIPTTHNKNPSKSKGSNPTIQSISIHGEISGIGLGRFDSLKTQLMDKFNNIKSPNGPICTKGLDADGSIYRDLISYMKDNYQMIYPGTVWCGNGDQAKTYNNLGFFYLTDSCCREHDHCKDFIDPGQVKNGLKNSGLFPRFNCKCDFELFNCLSRIDSFVSNMAGFVYFDVLAPQCYKKEYPIIDCEQETSGKCVKYWVDSTQKRRYQWIDNPIFIDNDIGRFY